MSECAAASVVGRDALRAGDGEADLIGNPSLVAPSWWVDDVFTETEWAWGAVMPGSGLPCGCHVRRPDYEAVLCEVHLAELNGDPADDPADRSSV